MAPKSGPRRTGPKSRDVADESERLDESQMSARGEEEAAPFKKPKGPVKKKRNPATKDTTKAGKAGSEKSEDKRGSEAADPAPEPEKPKKKPVGKKRLSPMPDEPEPEPVAEGPPNKKQKSDQEHQDLQTAFPPVPIPQLVDYGTGKPPQYIEPYRQSIITEVNEYTRTLVTELEARILASIAALADKNELAASSNSTDEGDNNGNQGGNGNATGNGSEGYSDLDKVTGGTKPGAKEDTEPHNPFDYPDLDNLVDGQESFDALRRYWTFHRAIFDTRNKPLNDKGQCFRTVPDFKGVELDLVFDAITCVTEAISQDPENGSPSMSLWSAAAYQAFRNWRNNHESEFEVVDDPERTDFESPFILGGAKVARPNADKLIIPFMISDQYLKGTEHYGDCHTILLYCTKESGKPLVFYLDSAPKHYEKNREKWVNIITTMLRRIEWIASDATVTISKTIVPSQRPRSQSCGILTIINAWCKALNLSANARPMLSIDPGNTFLAEAVQMVNLALSGYLDAATIFHWLRSRDYIRASDTMEHVPKFKRTMHIRSSGSVEGWRMSIDAGIPFPEIDTPPLPMLWPSAHHVGNRAARNDKMTAEQEASNMTELAKAENAVDLTVIVKEDDKSEFCRYYPAEVKRRQALNKGFSYV